jgi:hypothetical protein
LQAHGGGHGIIGPCMVSKRRIRWRRPLGDRLKWRFIDCPSCKAEPQTPEGALGNRIP